MSFSSYCDAVFSALSSSTPIVGGFGKFPEVGFLVNISDDCLIEILENIRKILHAKTFFATTEEKSFALIELLKEMSLQHWHQNVPTKDLPVIYCKKKQEYVSCDFHHESLLEHSILCMIISIQRALDTDCDPVLAGLIGLLHDIGKPQCAALYNTSLGYPFHGEYGASILSQYLSGPILEFISFEDYEILLRVISVHMCSYHTTHEDDWTTERRTIAQIETPRVKRFLDCLSYGDTFGKISDLSDNDAFLSSREAYNSMVNKTFDVKDFMESQKLYTMVVFVRGPSGFGKTTFIRDFVVFLKNYFEESQILIVSRDEIMARVTAMRIGHTLTKSRPEGEEYAKLYTAFKELRLSKVVNDEMRKMISGGISGQKIVIVDSVILLYEGAEYCMPDKISNAFIMSVDCVRNTCFTEDDLKKNGMNCPVGSLTSTREPMRWINTQTLNLKCLASKYTHSKKPEQPFIPHLCFQYGFNKDHTTGIDIMIRTIHPVLDYFSNTLEKIDTNTMDIIEYVNYLNNKYGYDGLRSAFMERAFRASNSHGFNDILRLAYLNHNGCWDPRWSRDTRGTTFMKVNGKMVPIKYALPRGCEVITGMQASDVNATESFELSGTTSDEKINSVQSAIQHLDDRQQKLIMTLMTNGHIDGGMRLSFKADGSLFIMTFYFDETLKKHITEFVNSTNDVFATKILQLCEKLNLPPLIISSQSTLLMSSDMLDWTLQSMLSTMMSDKEITEKYSGRSYLEVLDDQVFHQILVKMFTMVTTSASALNYPENASLSVCAETICMNRHSVFLETKEHPELAISYPESIFTILGLSMSTPDKVFSSPHFEFSEQISAFGFVEPCYWSITETSELNQMLNDLEEVIYEKISESAFFEKYPPFNKFSNWKPMIDREGFVTYDGSDNHMSKAKTTTYYKCHHLRPDNVELLMKLAQISSARQYFPLCREVQSFYSRLENDVNLMHTDFMMMCNDITSPLYNALSEKAKVSFQKQKPEIQLKMLINGSAVFNDVAIGIFSNLYPFNSERVGDVDEFRLSIVSCIKSILMAFATKTITFENASSNQMFSELLCVARKAMQSVN
jgi:hypothetical protein